MAGVLATAFMVLSTACAEKQAKPDVQPTTSQVRSICELSVMECYYHNVAKFDKKDAEGVLFWKKDKKFWVEYSGTVTVGVDASKVIMEISGSDVIITIPEAEVLGSTLDSSTLTKDSYIVAKESAAITAEDEIAALSAAQETMKEAAAEDKTLLAMAQQRAQQLLEDYVKNIGNAVGKSYSVKWKYLKENDTANTAA